MVGFSKEALISFSPNRGWDQSLRAGENQDQRPVECDLLY